MSRTVSETLWQSSRHHTLDKNTHAHRGEKTMTHDEIKQLLAAYCDGDITAVERAWVDEHLSSCPSCRADLADLKISMKLVKSMPEVEPPEWLASRIMANINDEPAKNSSILQHLFFPLHIKLPLEALTILLVCVSTYYLTRDVNHDIQQTPPVKQQTQPLQAPSKLPTDGLTQQSEIMAEAPKAEEPVRSAKTKVVRERAEETKTQDTSSQSSSVTSLPQSPPQIDRATAKSESADSPAPVDTTPAKSLAARPAKAKKSAERYQATAPITTVVKDTVASETLKIKLQAHQQSDIQEAVKRAVGQAGGSITAASENQENRTIKARLPAAKSAELINNLEKSGKVESRPVIPPDKDEIEVEISW